MSWRWNCRLAVRSTPTRRRWRCGGARPKLRWCACKCERKLTASVCLSDAPMLKPRRARYQPSPRLVLLVQSDRRRPLRFVVDSLASIYIKHIKQIPPPRHSKRNIMFIKCVEGFLKIKKKEN